MKHTGLLKGALRAAALGAALTCVTASFAQSFNIDINISTTTSPGHGGPSASFAGAAGMAGPWNALTGTGLSMNGLLDTNGSATGVNIARTSGAQFASTLNNPGLTGDYALLFWDIHDVGGATASATYTFSNLAPGTYEVYTYAIAPDSAAFITNVTVPGSTSANPQPVGGAIPTNNFALGVTHAMHDVVTCGTITVVVATASGFASINGFQIVQVSTDAPLCASGAADPNPVSIDGITLLTVTVTPGPTSTGIAVEADLSAISGSASQMFFDDGTNGDVTPGDNVFSYLANVPSGSNFGSLSLPFTVTDQQSGVFNGAIALTVLPNADFFEQEPNDTKADATPIIGISHDQSISGVTMGATGVNLDYFLVQTAPLPPGVYRHRLVLTTPGTAGHVGTIRGVSQIAAPADTMPGIPWDGVIGGSNPSTDVVRQTSLAAATGDLPPRTVQWYAFGKEEQIYYRVHGTATTTSPYFATLVTDPVDVEDIGTFEPGLITMNWFGQGHTSDTSIWVYDSDFNAIPGYGNEDASAALAGAPLPGASSFQSWLAREYEPGVYYIAVSTFRAASNQPAASDDNYRIGALMDFPDSWVSSTSSFGTNMAFTIEDSEGNSLQVPNTKAGPFGSNFFKFTVGSPGTPCPADLTGSGSVGVADLLALLASWGPCPAPCPADLTGSGNVGVADLLALLAQWGPCP